MTRVKVGFRISAKWLGQNPSDAFSVHSWLSETAEAHGSPKHGPRRYRIRLGDL